MHGKHALELSTEAVDRIEKSVGSTSFEFTAFSLHPRKQLPKGAMP